MTRFAWRALGVVLGAALAGCGDKDDTEDTGMIVAEYGVMEAEWAPAEDDATPDDLEWDVEAP